MAIVYRIARADFIERVRRTGFLVAILLTVLLSFVFSPPADAGYVTLVFDRYVGIYNSAWMGTSVAISMTVFFSLIGFYLIANGITLDRRSGVAQLIAASPIGRARYLLGKFASNFAVLAVIIAVTMVMALIMQLTRGEDTHVRLWQLSAPFLFLVLPLMAIVAAAAIWFEIIPWLRGTVGTVVYFVMWIATVFMSRKPVSLGPYLTLSDPYGQKIPIDSVGAFVQKQFSDYNGEVSQGLTWLDEPPRKFVWEGIQWTVPLVTGRLLWIVVAVLAVGAASLFFRMFRGEREALSPTRKTQAAAGPDKAAASGEAFASGTILTPVQARPVFLPVLIGELRLLFSGLRWWSVGAGLLLLLEFVCPLSASTKFILPLAWIWPLALWSAMGSREIRYRTGEWVYASKSGRRLLPATWLSGMLLSFLTSLGIAVRLLVEEQWGSLLGLLVAAVFVPTFALACGIWSRGSRTFEILYLSLWFLGPLNHMPVLNFMDLGDARLPFIYSLATVVLYAAAVLGRRLELSR